MDRPTKAQARGQWAERRAAWHLRGRGLKLIARNYRCRFGEVDLIMSDGEATVFVEVKRRRNDAFMNPAESVDVHKQRRLAMAAGAFLAAHPRYGRHPARFDVVTITGPNYRPRFDWIRDAFQLDDSAGH
ncbi:MAG: YraN family protein [Gammaproteobacteria bacterium]|nr:YraN family protein [Gammaproteobacteria bacterium]MCY4343906.1 YraN family protein [Gammaproteobacteria bacterium]